MPISHRRQALKKLDPTALSALLKKGCVPEPEDLLWFFAPHQSIAQHKKLKATSACAQLLAQHIPASIWASAPLVAEELLVYLKTTPSVVLLEAPAVFSALSNAPPSRDQAHHALEVMVPHQTLTEGNFEKFPHDVLVPWVGRLLDHVRSIPDWDRCVLGETTILVQAHEVLGRAVLLADEQAFSVYARMLSGVVSFEQLIKNAYSLIEWARASGSGGLNTIAPVAVERYKKNMLGFVDQHAPKTERTKIRRFLSKKNPDVVQYMLGAMPLFVAETSRKEIVSAVKSISGPRPRSKTKAPKM